MKPEVRIHVTDEDGSWSFPINCPQWLLKVLEKLEKKYDYSISDSVVDE
jgi:hypothetical protein